MAANTSIDGTRSATAMRWLCIALVFVQPIPHVGAMRQLATYGLLLAMLLRIFFELRTHVIGRLSAGFGRWFWLLGLWALIASVIGPYPGDSLNAMRQGWLPQGLLVAAILLDFDSRPWQLLLLRALVYGFVAATLLGAGETLLTHGQLINGGVISHDAFLRGYAHQAVVSIPITLFLIFFPTTHRAERIALSILILCGVARRWLR
jgi:hypothetical protein